MKKDKGMNISFLLWKSECYICNCVTGASFLTQPHSTFLHFPTALPSLFLPFLPLSSVPFQSGHPLTSPNEPCSALTCWRRPRPQRKPTGHNNKRLSLKGGRVIAFPDMCSGVQTEPQLTLALRMNLASRLMTAAFDSMDISFTRLIGQ